MKKVIATIIAVGVTSVSTAGVDYADAYVFRGTTVSSEASIQPSMETSVLGLDVSVWAAYNTEIDAFEEVDFAIGMPLTTIAGADLSVGLCEYTYDGVLEADTEASLYIDYALAGVDLSAAINKTLDGTLADFNIYSASYGFDITEGIAGSVSYELGTVDTGTADGEAYTAVTLSASTSLTDALDLGVTYVSLSEGDADVNTVDDVDSVTIVSISGDLF